MKEKVRRLKVEMLAFWLVYFKAELPVEIKEKDKNKVDKMKTVFLIIEQISKNKFEIQPHLKQLQLLYQGNSDEFDWWIFMVLSLLYRF